MKRIESLSKSGNGKGRFKGDTLPIETGPARGALFAH